jgi:hypothetical protein
LIPFLCPTIFSTEIIEPQPILQFAETSYTGQYAEDNQVTHPDIKLVKGFHAGIVFEIEGRESINV